MKIRLLVLFISITFSAFCQQDTVATDVFKLQYKARETKQTLLSGSTLDLSNLTINLFTVAPHSISTTPVEYADKEQLIIVKSGSIQLSAGKQTTSLGAGGLALIIAGDRQQIINTSNQDAIYYVISYTAKQAVNIERGISGGGSFMIDWKDMEVKQTNKGQSRPIFDRPSSMFPHFDVHATTLNPGISSHAAHTHRVEEIILMISGNGNMQLGEKFKKASGGDVIFVNAMVPHAITNIGTGAMQLFCYTVAHRLINFSDFQHE